jgi:hypothetical protein
LPQALAYSVDHNTESPAESLGPLSGSSAQFPASAGDEVIDTPDMQEAESDKKSPPEPPDSLSESLVPCPDSAGGDVINAPNMQEAESDWKSTTSGSRHSASTSSAQGPAEPPNRSDIQGAARHAALVESADDSLTPSGATQGCGSPRSPQQSGLATTHFLSSCPATKIGRV